jgi:hypothetical protein
MKSAYIIGFIAMFPVALIMCCIAMVAIADEIDNLAATRLRQQLRIDKAHMLKVPEIHKRNRTQECQLFDTQIQCVAYPGGVQTIAVAK